MIIDKAQSPGALKGRYMCSADIDDDFLTLIIEVDENTEYIIRLSMPIEVIRVRNNPEALETIVKAKRRRWRW